MADVVFEILNFEVWVDFQEYQFNHGHDLLGTLFCFAATF